MPEKPDLTALLGSRICHDLISPIGAIGNGLELLMMDGGNSSPEMVLIADSVANADARIRFFRVAFGMAQTDQRIGKAEVRQVLSDVTRGSRLQIDWISDADLFRVEVKIIFLLIQCLENAMAYGGRITVSTSEGRWLIAGQASKLKINTSLWEILVDPAALAEVTPAVVQFPLVADELQRRGLRLKTTLNDSEILLEF